MGESDEVRGSISPDIRKWDDVYNYNPLDVTVKKLGTLVNDEATFDLDGDSSLIEPLKTLCKDAESKRYEICSTMLGEGGVFVTLATNEDSEPYHRIIPPQDASVYRILSGKIYEIAMVIDRITVKKKSYTLVRHHNLDENGTLSIVYYCLDSLGKETYLEEWEHYKNDNTVYLNANHIGVTYFKSPQDSNGLEPFFGVPLNFACQAEEEKLIEAKKMVWNELNNAQMKLFVDKSIVRKSSDQSGYELPESVYLMSRLAGTNGPLIEEFAPGTRYEDYKNFAIDAGHEYEDRMGLNSGFVTPAEYTSNATATEIRTANTKTISMVKKVQSAMADGIRDLMLADNILMLIPLGLWSLKIDWFDAFADEQTQYERIISAAEKGYAEDEDVVRFIFPMLTQDEITEKLERIRKARNNRDEEALERILSGA